MFVVEVARYKEILCGRLNADSRYLFRTIPGTDVPGYDCAASAGWEL